MNHVDVDWFGIQIKISLKSNLFTKQKKSLLGKLFKVRKISVGLPGYKFWNCINVCSIWVCLYNCGKRLLLKLNKLFFILVNKAKAQNILKSRKYNGKG